MKTTKTRAALAIAAALLGACIFPSLDGLTGSSDAGVDAADATSAADAGDAAPRDASVDAPSDAISNTTFFCASVDAALCDDFDDEDGSTFMRWTSAPTAHGATITRDDSDASPPFAARFDAFGSDAGSPLAVLKKKFTDPITSSATLAFDLRVDAWPTPSTAGLNVAQVNLASGASATTLRLRQTNSQLEQTVPTDAGNIFPTFALSQSPVLGQWVHVELDWTLAQNDVTVTVLFDGNVVLAPTALDPTSAFGVPTLLAGEVFIDPGNQSTSMRVDNVVFRYQ
ncbi:MAG TPA: hypothetical protein VGH28_18405 [Polyangiaceae bacterium]|jgi:hypothetical protein